MRIWNLAFIGRHSPGLEVDYGDPVVLDANPVHRTGDHASVCQCRSKWYFRERTLAEKVRERGVVKDAADLLDDLIADLDVENSGGAFEPSECSVMALSF